ncbi:ribose-5-phosphate isomerase RpiA [Paenibacillus sp. 481]|uniref:ribose-5-phosphate isomerase RpiA n=1 Tax=Paenibacillus sp. 481 TaxID=2835869 RepID=UPI001E32A927|nr:ribose-5-phosphate isomerase RpiA [Paenibacillus sp. 481]UHA73698.1 ribose-5-phosphate isomerase RpiA [Paenibacillus sp. 481]
MNAKQLAAEKAVAYIQDGMVVGLGTGSTAYWAIHKIAERVHAGLHIRAVASSEQSERLALELGIPIVPFSQIDEIDISIDGADEVDTELNLIKGGGGALLREKVLAANSKQFIVIVDESKLVNKLGKFPLPVEIVPFAANLTINKLTELAGEVNVRSVHGREFVTDNGNLIVDCYFQEIANAKQLNQQLNLIPGVVDNGLFVGMVQQVIVGYADGTVTEMGVS